jgi:membrane peptidoglycan carboxypeptidase
VQGGSSITQQLAKNLFLTPERSMRRKIHEAFLAMWIEARLSKDEIFKMYLDRSYLGGGTYGVEAAAQFYFGKSIRDVTLAEAAMLAGLFKAPSRFAPHVNIHLARARANVVLYRMLDVGYITQGELFDARRRPAEVVSVPNLYSPDYFLDWAYRETLQLLDQHGLRGDYVLEVKTTLDIEMHQAAHRIVNEMLETPKARPINATRPPSSPWSRTERSRRSSAGVTTRTASSTAPPRPCASRVRRSSPSSTWPPCATASSRIRSSMTRRSGSGAGRRRTTTANTPAAPP